MKPYIAAIDIGKKNFAFVIEELAPVDRFTGLQTIAKTSRYHKTGTKELIGTPTVEFADALDRLHRFNKVILVSNNDLTTNAVNKNILEEQIFINMMKVAPIVIFCLFRKQMHLYAPVKSGAKFNCLRNSKINFFVGNPSMAISTIVNNITPANMYCNIKIFHWLPTL